MFNHTIKNLEYSLKLRILKKIKNLSIFSYENISQIVISSKIFERSKFNGANDTNLKIYLESKYVQNPTSF